MSLTRMQRDAMKRAQRGDWELADAMEVAARCHDSDCIGGVRQGGRLQFLAFGQSGEDGGPECSGDLMCECDACIDTVDRIETLNGDVVYSADRDGDDWPHWFRGVDLQPEAAHAALEAYTAAILKPTQTTLIPEHA